MSDIHHQIVVIGGGAAGLAVAARLARITPKLDVAIVEPSDTHYYQPLWTLVGGGVFRREQSARPMSALIPDGVSWIRDAVLNVWPEKNCLQTVGEQRIGYDWLIVAPGIQIDWGKVKGLPETLGKNGVCSNYSYETASYTWECLQSFQGGEALFTFPATPIKCAGAPQKIMYLAEEHFRRRGIRHKAHISYLCAQPVIFSCPYYAKVLMENIIPPREIDVLFRHNLVEVRGETREAVFQNLETSEEVVRPFDLLHVAPPMSAPDFIKRSTLANEAGWVDVHKNTLRHNRFANVFALGDASSLPTSKTAAAVRAQFPVLTQNLLDAMAGKEPAAQYDGYTSCPLVTGYGKLILAEFDYELKPRETFPFDQRVERKSMYWLKKYVLPVIYWEGLVRGRTWPWFGP